jgi:hypothetical protein
MNKMLHGFQNLKSSYKIIILIWILHLYVFVGNINCYPILTYDLFGRINNFHNTKEVFLAKTEGGQSFNQDISSEISFDYYWKFIVTVRRMLRESPQDLDLAFKRRIVELNTNRSVPITAVQFIEFTGGEQKVLFEVHRE